jgi:RNA polymerase sigma-70 factor, ECF subfamily
VISDTHLVAAALAGDPAAFEQLVRAYQDRLYVSMLQVTGSAEEAEDVVQDAFVRSFLKLHTFQQNSQFFTWLYRIAINSALSRRRKKRHTLSIDQINENAGLEPVGKDESPDEHLLQMERTDLVRRALAQVSEDHRSILVLREMEDCSYEQIAEILEIQIGTVRSRLSRARAALKTVIESLEQPGSGS